MQSPKIGKDVINILGVPASSMPYERFLLGKEPIVAREGWTENQNLRRDHYMLEVLKLYLAPLESGRVEKFVHLELQNREYEGIVEYPHVAELFGVEYAHSLFKGTGLTKCEHELRNSGEGDVRVGEFQDSTDDRGYRPKSPPAPRRESEKDTTEPDDPTVMDPGNAHSESDNADVEVASCQSEEESSECSNAEETNKVNPKSCEVLPEKRKGPVLKDGPESKKPKVEAKSQTKK